MKSLYTGDVKEIKIDLKAWKSVKKCVWEVGFGGHLLQGAVESFNFFKKFRVIISNHRFDNFRKKLKLF